MSIESSWRSSACCLACASSLVVSSSSMLRRRPPLDGKSKPPVLLLKDLPLPPGGEGRGEGVHRPERRSKICRHANSSTNLLEPSTPSPCPLPQGGEAFL